MATNVVVIDTSFRKVTIKVTPAKFLSEVLEEACVKLKLNASNYGLKNNNKAVNLSLPFRQTGLVSGAKLNLVVASKSPVPISVALQLPASIASGGRLTDKFPSDTTLWLILRKFETTGGSNLNFTARGVTELENGASGAGRIYFEMPVLNVMGRELSTFTDLQKTLAQLGCSGNVLMRLGFRKTEQPLEEAMVTINEYFKEDQPASNVNESSDGAEEGNMFTAAMAKLTSKGPETTSTEPASEDTEMAGYTTTDSLPKEIEETQTPAPVTSSVTAIPPSPEPKNQDLGPDGQPIVVYRAPSNSVPAAALVPHNEDDYEPTVAHAKMHQIELLDRSHNKRLPSDAEAEQQERERADKLAKTKDVKIRLRFPDQSSVQATFDATKSGSDLYLYVTGLIAAESEPFKLTWFKDRGSETIPSDGKKLIKDLGFRGNTIVNFIWGDDARESVRKVATLKAQYVEKAKDVPVPQLLSSSPEVKTAVAPDEKGKGKEGEPPKKKGLGNLNRFVKGLSKK